MSGCDREPDPAPQESERTGTGEAAATGEIDRSFAGELMPAANLVNPADEVLNLGALQGRPVLVNLWATWCAPCVKEMPLLDELAADYGGALNVVTVSQDMEGPAKVAAFFEENGLENLPQWIDPQLALGEAIGASTLPTTVLYDRQGQEVWRVTGDYDWASEEARAAIEEVVETPQVP
ncbi:TlpA family protein disulfide reductase [Alteriqipengyuania lutimaris]|uniref:TlpA family protein disulfide reductase n=1 Tax=Alteriqipengyuania lutimaris TaxID=1538146 RepID=UPI001807E495|nr:TlpA disulfide reductase family protein [Alteriqipengyuania lutimaris]MBB3033340.1 thiol-disulfide isomerase/thioredoxin [Alteriqipengyuania lutimaris]